MRIRQNIGGSRQQQAGYVGGLWEVLIAFVIVAVSFGTIVGGYVSGATKAEWSGFSLAAQTLSQQTLEQTRSAAWDAKTGKIEILSMNLINKVTNATAGGGWTMTGYTTNILDVPWHTNNYSVATNFITISQVFVNGVTNPNIQLQMVRVDTVWPFAGWGKFSKRTYTNTVGTLLAPDNRAPF